MPAYYNEIDPYAAQWLRELIKHGHIADGDVDERDIRDVQPADLRGYAQCHFFAGIGGWSRALRLAAWCDNRSVWTGSCPCQPFSSAGKRESVADKRHLWPHWFRLIRECRPSTIFGEQVARAVGHQWLDAAAHDLEEAHYATGSVVLPACSVGAPHIRERLWFVAHANGESQHVGTIDAEVACASQFVANATGTRCQHAKNASADRRHEGEGESEDANRGWIGSGVRQSERSSSGTGTYWTAEPSVGVVAHGVPARVGKLRALGNAIVPQVAAEFIMSFVEMRTANCGAIR